RGKLLGLGLANYVESSIGAPKEQARITVRPEGRVAVVIGTQASGQGHATSFAQVVSDLLHVPAETVKIIYGDTDVVKVGGGSHSGRSMRHAATVFSMATVALIDKGKKIAAVLLNVPPNSIDFTDDGRFASRETNRSFDFLEPESGQPLCGSLMDYGMPRSDNLPAFRTEIAEVLSPTNPLGIKAGGEGGTTAAPAVIVSAILDALRPYGVHSITMPATPFTV